MNHNLDKGTINKNDISKLAIEYPELFSWQYVMIDEGQDWPIDERDLIYKLFGPNKIIVADGIGQLIRNEKPCDWRNTPLCKESQVVPLKKSLRQKSNLTRFIKEIVSKLEIDEWNVEVNEELAGGKVIILDGLYTPDFHKRLIQQNKEDKNENVDMLFCVPPNYKAEYENLELTDTFLKWGFSIWDGVDVKKRKTFPTKNDQLRLVSYDSCRGLEAWMCVNIAFDKFYQYKFTGNKNKKIGQLDFTSEEDRMKLYADQWLLIPLTRAIDTIVLQIEDPSNRISKILKEVYINNKQYIEWISCRQS